MHHCLLSAQLLRHDGQQGSFHHNERKGHEAELCHLLGSASSERKANGLRILALWLHELTQRDVVDAFLLGLEVFVCSTKPVLGFVLIIFDCWLLIGLLARRFINAPP